MPLVKFLDGAKKNRTYKENGDRPEDDAGTDACRHGAVMDSQQGKEYIEHHRERGKKQPSPLWNVQSGERSYHRQNGKGKGKGKVD